MVKAASCLLAAIILTFVAAYMLQIPGTWYEVPVLFWAIVLTVLCIIGFVVSTVEGNGT